MLNLFIKDISDMSFIESLPFITDVNKEFDKLGLSGSTDEELFLNRLEHGKSIPGDSYAYIDRFGFKLSASDMSTGCKAAICVLRSTSKIIDLTECGLNAVGMILSWCREGNIYIPGYAVTFPDYSESLVSIRLNNYIFSTLSRLNDYLDNEWPYEPDMKKEGIRHV